MRFNLTNSFDENLAIFRAEAERVDADCARILFANLATMCQDKDASHDREAIREFHSAVLAALDNLPDPQEGEGP